VPIYEYQCDSCNHQLETLQKISDPLLTTCPECGQDSLRKRVSAAAFRLKGGGWYETDFKDNKTRRHVAGKEENAPSGDKQDTKDTGKEKKEETSQSGSGSSESIAGKNSTGADKTAVG